MLSRYLQEEQRTAWIEAGRSKVREETETSQYFSQRKKAEKPRKIKTINALGPNQTTNNSQTLEISGTNSSRMLISGQLTIWVVQEFSFLSKRLCQKQSKEIQQGKDELPVPSVTLTWPWSPRTPGPSPGPC